jgi:hypothetical protein
VIDDRLLASRDSDAMSSTLRNSAAPNLWYGTSFQIRVSRRDDGSVALLLLGDLDITSMVQFERLITEVLSVSPKELIFDLTQSQFISAQGYAAIGRCSLEVPVRVRSSTVLASKVLAIYGYEQVAIAIERESDLTLPW